MSILMRHETPAASSSCGKASKQAGSSADLSSQSLPLIGLEVRAATPLLETGDRR
jgi:hypothetical protein